MKSVRFLVALFLLPLALSAADRLLKADPAKSYVDVDVKVTIGDFTAHLDRYDLTAVIDAKNKFKSGVLTFKFADLKTGKPDRDEAMVAWLGGDNPTGKFEIGIIALTPDGQGRVTGNLTFHGTSSLVEFPVMVVRDGSDYTITGEVTVDYRNWNLKKIRKAGLITVDPEVKVRFKFAGTTVEAPPAPPAAK
jgi:polyisoprenoid-binding protein YceI